MAMAGGGMRLPMAAVHLAQSDHDIRGVRITRQGDGFVVHCPCGWASAPRPRTTDATTEWQRHRDRTT